MSWEIPDKPHEEEIRMFEALASGDVPLMVVTGGHAVALDRNARATLGAITGAILGRMTCLKSLTAGVILAGAV